MVSEVADGKDTPPRHRIYNIGNHSPEPVTNMIGILEGQLSRKARIELEPLPPGDMVETFADVSKLQHDYGFSPDTPLETGLRRFTDWFVHWRAQIGLETSHSA